MKVLFVCLGNICRSPLAEAIFKKKVTDAGQSGKITADSAGTSGWHIGEPPDTRTTETAARHGIPIDHKGRKFERRDLETFDYIVAMDDENMDDILILKGGSSEVAANIVKMLDFDNSASGSDVPDPYYGGQAGFEKVYALLDESTANLLESIVGENELSP